MNKLRQLYLEHSNLLKRKRSEVALLLSYFSIDDIKRMLDLEGDGDYSFYRDIIINWYIIGDLDKIKEFNFPLYSNEKLDTLIKLASNNISEYLSTKEGQKQVLMNDLYFWINAAIRENKTLDGDDNVTYIELNDDNTVLTIYCHNPEKLIGFGNGLIMSIKEKINDNCPQIAKIKVEKHTKYEF